LAVFVFLRLTQYWRTGPLIWPSRHPAAARLPHLTLTRDRWEVLTRLTPDA